MGLLNRGLPHCKQCGCELAGTEETCPSCEFNPRAKGLRVAMALFMVVILSMTVTMGAMLVWIELTPFLIWLAVIAFILSFLTFFVSFLATPYRLGSLFTWF